MIDCQYLEPTTVSEACALLAEHGDGAKVVAGGQSMAILLRNGLIQPSHLISIQHVLRIGRHNRIGRRRNNWC